MAKKPELATAAAQTAGRVTRAVDRGYTNFYRYKSLSAFNSSRTSVVEDIVIQAEARQRRERVKYAND